MVMFLKKNQMYIASAMGILLYGVVNMNFLKFSVKHVFERSSSDWSSLVLFGRLGCHFILVC